MKQIENLPFKIPNFDLTDKVAVITGSSKGFGYGMAIIFAYYGANVVINSRHQDDCDKVAKEIIDIGRDSLAFAADVRNKEEVDNLIKATIKRFGKIDIMVNNAGTGTTGKAEEISELEWDRVVDTNLKGVFLGATAAANEMIKQGHGGSIINISSAGGLVGSKYIAPYCASKSGVISLTKSLALEWGKYNIRVNSICPGYVITDINKKTMENPRAVDKIINKTALKRFGEIDEIAAVALFLACDCSSIMTGAFVAADMGTTAN